MDMKIECPYCKATYYMVRYSTTTAVYYPPIYKSGININPDKNITTYVCECQNCGKTFSYQECMGEVI